MTYLEPTIEKRLQRILPGAMSYVKARGETKLLDLTVGWSAPKTQPSERLLINLKKIIKDHPLTNSIQPDQLIDDLTASFHSPVLAANHQGLDTHPEMVQGLLLFGLPTILGLRKIPIVILATGSAPLNNPTGPGAIMLGRRGCLGQRLMARMFSRSRDGLMAAFAPLITKDLVHNRLTRLKDLTEWTNSEKGLIKVFLEKWLLDPEFLSQNNFANQSAWLAQAFWARHFGRTSQVEQTDQYSQSRPSVPPICHLELEKLVNAILTQDLVDQSSVAYYAMFDPNARNALLVTLAGQRGTWCRELAGSCRFEPNQIKSGQFERCQLYPSRLSHCQINPAQMDTQPAVDLNQSRGTIFFWGVHEGRRFPLALAFKGSTPILKGTHLELPLTPTHILTALAENQIYPGLFLDYLVLASHGVLAHGGTLMTDYLPPILAQAGKILGCSLINEFRPLPVAGLLPIGARGSEGFSAAGALELFGADPWGHGLAQKLANLTINQVWPLTAREWYQEITPVGSRVANWRSGLDGAALELASSQVAWAA
ncbi:MAG: hypothetical protein LBT86_10205 [Deltaproteobacteria bacterium]|jgi:hypothetical protein|nr:hypothetical protein [Deltaproteobacteria bacterium]